ncbi:translocator protein-like [Diadema antillarum]|uniref:translocator protein-like n=1 Tax=Diadema antillarum TaxID=105358 RepID=UPI003A8891C7
MSDYVKIAGAVVLPFLGGFASARVMKKDTMTWYDTLKKPWWTPPKAAFGPVWTSLYAAMGYSSYLVWRDGGGFEGKALVPLCAYGASLALNWVWTPVFFGMKKLGLSVAIIIAYGGVTGVTTYLFHPINRTASMLLFPLLGWISLASSINIYTWLYNREETKTE